jgi:hypothetical protein
VSLPAADVSTRYIRINTPAFGPNAITVDGS